MNKNGFSLIEIVFTIIIIGLAMGAITESFIAGSAKSVNIVNEETAVNVAKREMAALNYCRNGGPLTSGVCSAFQTRVGSGSSPWIASLPNPSPQVPTLVNNECFYTTVNPKWVNFTDTNGNGTISVSGSPTDFIQTIVQTGWFAANGGGTSCPAVPANYPYVTLSTVYADY
ncbi:MAG: prepilin-type N-terminal cleavage/methylation domain-containing protein [Deltaproteobacteria bacterium]|nr:prepilin-type N-terminal cleavage/methylation domain-containing protein [Deltaproteobacteria bacterium]